MHDQESDGKFTKKRFNNEHKNTDGLMAVVRRSRNPQKQARADVRQITRQAGSKPGFQTDRQRHQRNRQGRTREGSPEAEEPAG